MKKITFLLFSMLIGNHTYANIHAVNAAFAGRSGTFAIPECAVVLSPASGQTGVVINADLNNLITLNWTAPLFGDPVTSYNIYFGQHVNEMYLLGSTPDFTFSIDGIFPNTTYYWQAVPVNADGQALGCETWSFTTETTAPITPDYITNFSIAAEGWYRATGPINGQVTKVFENDWDYFEFANQSDGPNGFAAYINLFNNSTPSYNWFISPLFDLSASPLYLNFDIALTSFRDPSASAFSSEEFVALLVSEDDGLTWSELERWDQNATINFQGEASLERTLTQTGTTRFAFYSFISENSESNVDFFIDNFRITQNLAIGEQEKAILTFYPNPVIDVLNFSASEIIKAVTVYNLLGQQVLYKAVNDLGSTINMSGLPSGNYIARADTANGVKTVKLVKN